MSTTAKIEIGHCRRFLFTLPLVCLAEIGILPVIRGEVTCSWCQFLGRFLSAGFTVFEVEGVVATKVKVRVRVFP